jgi:hypothetical protein
MPYPMGRLYFDLLTLADTRSGAQRLLGKTLATSTALSDFSTKKGGERGAPGRID